MLRVMLLQNIDTRTDIYFCVLIKLKEGQGRQNRKLAIAHHRRRNGKSEFVVAQNTKGLWGKSDDSLIGHVTANLLGSKYQIWDQVHFLSTRIWLNSILPVRLCYSN